MVPGRDDVGPGVLGLGERGADRGILRVLWLELDPDADGAVG
jgi:hypothetical protein